ncbi:uncharacterized protein LACBIDRAFT_296104 [Laccaria bicolor S238N-H82]|uniref:Predicted protein n=1 Tax=Laccaria bicolor (strain S238N-H82 / ATCC MYA-4686) TaxID=486041 RepID=B0DZF3_LACBS|nr:uncharacterized protein LACBIDRAFT_314896 [Laccaria bicolor S238N-H82]XP_001890518.1 uncharacterized protein LACBIDRAFT_296104 [Laccaria bicolor S238N-H82]EDQ98832.1 predicted protein [Laccaria bicolor S238N-H82]EDR00034.1 predicted protein [Laccaria bicolor S238N-H82]|eukprot:XP_001889343.1 predicted protein [Laccaria bicolor S238N-H82]
MLRTTLSLRYPLTKSQVEEGIMRTASFHELRNTQLHLLIDKLGFQSLWILLVSSLSLLPQLLYRQSSSFSEYFPFCSVTHCL